jgi:ribose transport system permease protein
LSEIEETMQAVGTAIASGGHAMGRLRSLSGIAYVIPFLLLCLLFTALAPGFVSGANVAAIIEQSAIPLIVSIGLTFVIMSGAIDLSMEGVMAVCSVLVALLVSNTVNENNFGLAGVLAVLALGAAAGALNGWMNTRLGLPSFVATLGMWSIGVGSGTALLAAFAPYGNPELQAGWMRDLAALGPFRLSAITWIAALVFVTAWLIQNYSVFGRRTMAIGGDEATARASGINVDATKVGIFAFAGLLYALGGVLTSSRLAAGTVSVGADTLFTAITAVVVGGTPLVGGRGGVANTLVGVLTLSVLANGMILSGIPPFYQLAVKGAIILIALVLGGWSLRKPMRVVK